MPALRGCWSPRRSGRRAGRATRSCRPGSGRSARRRRALRRPWRSAASVYAALIQRFVVAPNEQVTRDAVHRSTTSRATRAAFAPRPRRGARALRRRRCSRATTSTQRRHARATCRSGITSRCSTPSARSRRSAPTTTSSSVDNDRYTIDGEYRQIMLSARELNSASLPNRTWINERLTFTHGYGADARAGEPGDARGAAGALHQGPAAGVDRATSKVDRAEHLLRRAVERPRVRAAPRPRSSTTRGATTTSSRRYEGDGRRAGRQPAARRLLFAIRFRSTDDAALATTSPPRAASCSTAAIAERVRTHRAVPDLRPRPVPRDRRRAACSGSRTPTRPAAAIPYSTPRAGGINYIRNSVKVDDRRLPRHDDLLPASTRRIPIAATLRQDLPRPAPAARPRCPRTCARACATRRTSSRCRPRCSRPTT